MIPDAPAADYVDLPWGSANDDNLVKIFKYISTGAFARVSVSERMSTENNLRLSIPSTIHPLRFNGMVDYRISNQMKGVINKSLRRAH